MHAMRMMMMMMITVFEKVTDDRGVRPAPLRLGTDDSICLPPSPKPFFPRGSSLNLKDTHIHMCGALWEISVHDNGDEETGVQIDLPLSNTISQIRLQRPFIFQQLPQIL